MTQQLPAIIFLIPFFTAILMPMIGMKNRNWCRPGALGALLIMSVGSIWMYGVILFDGPISYAFSGWKPPIGIEWIADGLSGLLMPVVSLLAFLTVLFAGPTTPAGTGGRIPYYYTLILLLISGLSGIVMAGDLFNVFVFLEVASLASYALVALSGGRALISAFRYLILGTLGASLYLLGVGYFYAVTGTLNMADVSTHLPELLKSKAVMAGLIFMVLGLAIKMALVPLHGWLPDAYAHAPNSITPILAPLVTKVAVFAVVRILFWTLGAKTVIHDVPILLLLSCLGAIAAIVGAFLALSQQEIKRLFAYGGISHVGLILIGICLGNQTGFAGGVFYLINDAVMQAVLFFIAASVFYRYGIRTISDMVNIRGQMPWTTAALVIAALSMIGIPPTGGFFGKWYIILGALDAENYLGVAAVIAATLLTLAYFVKIFENVFFESAPPTTIRTSEIPGAMKFSMGALSAAIIILGFFSDHLVTLILEHALPPGLLT
jgi:multicomponent Na+:H+ antiporter subunit D